MVFVVCIWPGVPPRFLFYKDSLFTMAAALSACRRSSNFFITSPSLPFLTSHVLNSSSLLR